MEQGSLAQHQAAAHESNPAAKRLVRGPIQGNATRSPHPDIVVSKQMPVHHRRMPRNSDQAQLKHDFRVLSDAGLQGECCRDPGA